MKTKSKTTAILVIHGVGQQHPFQTLESFASTLWETLERQSTISVQLPGHHRIARRKGWIQNYFSLSDAKNKHDVVDIYEYYWAHKAQRQVTLGHIVDWLITTSDGARKYYNENASLAKEYEGRGVTAFKNNSFDDLWYLKQFGWLFKILSFLPSYVPSWVANKLGWLVTPLSPIFKFIKQQLIDYLGDVVLYTSSDIKSQFYNVRSEILKGAVEELTEILKDPKYDSVIVAGHSLGSVIGYDALNRVNHALNTGTIGKSDGKKIKGFVTFGSPLDKIAFFFREHTADDEYLRRQILNHYHSFKAKSLDTQPIPKVISNPFTDYLDHVYWINFWDPQDVISGHLDFYRLDANVPMDFEKSIFSAHTAYWKDEKMYGEIIKKWF